jgi:uncharacterized protein YcfJ
MLSDARVSVNRPWDGILCVVMMIWRALRIRSRRRALRLLAGLTAMLLLASSCSQVPRYQVLPGQGQSSETLDRDRYECALQAQKQTNFDPARAMTAGALTGLVVGGALGAGLGAAAGISGGVVGTGASFGAIAGGTTGAMLGGSYLHEKGLNDTQRAFYGCLAGRGYTIK